MYGRAEISGRWHGFLCFWVYWMGIAFLLPTAALFYMGAGFYALGPRCAHLADNRFCLLAAALVAIWVALGTNLAGVERRQVDAEYRGRRLPGCWAVCWWCWRCAGGRQTRLGHPHPRASAVELGHGQLLVQHRLRPVGSGNGGHDGRPKSAIPRARFRAPAGSPRDSPRSSICAATVALLVLLRPERISELNGLAEAGESAGLASGRPVASAADRRAGDGQRGGAIRRRRHLRSRACPSPPAWTTCCRGPSRACIPAGERRTSPSSRSARWRRFCC